MLEHLKLYDIKNQKIRLGNQWDGGYVVPEILLQNCVSLFAYGIGDDTSFELDFVERTKKHVYLFDHTVSQIKINFENIKALEHMTFKNEGLSHETREKLNNFCNQYDELGITGPVLLKIDIEGGEFDYFLNSDISEIAKRVVGMIIEFHPTDNPEHIEKYFKVLAKINEYFYNCHIHGNNYAATVPVSNNDVTIELPKIIEMTFIKKDLVSASDVTLDYSDLPTRYDRKNDLNRPEVSLDFIKIINKLGEVNISNETTIINTDYADGTPIDSRMIYISLSTVPVRLKLWDTFKRNLESLLNQKTNRDYKIILNIPYYYNNNNNEEYVISQELSDFIINNPKIILNRVEKDYGPVVKLTGAIQYIRDLNSVLIVCDDDHIYHEDMLEYHLKKLNEYPDSIICFRGDDAVDKRYWYEDGVLKYALMPTHFYFPTKYDMQLIRPGHWHSVGYRREYFGDDFLDEKFLSLATNDDILTGYYFKLKQIDFICVAYDKETDWRAVNDFGRPAYSFPIVQSLPFPSSGFDEYRKQCGHHMGYMDKVIEDEFTKNREKILIKQIPKKVQPENKVNTDESLVEFSGRKVIVTLTTIPERLKAMHDSGIKSNIKSLIEQDYDGYYEIHINIPKQHKHTGEEYVIPDWMRELSAQYPKFKIFDGLEDLGTMTKLVPTIKRVDEPDAILIVCDDDLIYHPKMVEEQVKNQINYKDTACGYDGGLTIRNEFGDQRNHFVVSVPRDIEVRILQHYKTVSYQRYFFKDDLFEEFMDISWNDDISFSAYLGKHGFKKIVRTYDDEPKLLTLEEWQLKGGVTTFPVISHTSHGGEEGCWHYRSKGVRDNHEKYVRLGWI